VPPERVERKLAAILAADVAGYSRLMGIDEEGTLADLKAHRRELIDTKIAEHRGRVVKTTGDGILIEFPSVVDAVRCAIDVQRGMVERAADKPQASRIEFRIGINVGDIIIDGDDIHGDGVNIASRLEGIAEPGGICLSEYSYQQVRDKLETRFEDLGEQQLKNIARPVRVYRALLGDTRVKERPATLVLPDKPSIAVLPFQNMSGDAQQQYFADGVVEEIITALSRMGWLFVIARNSTFAYKDRSADVRQVGRELGVRYVLEGSVRKATNRVRIAGQLVDTATGAHLWADRFDGRLDDIFDLQDRVTESVVGAIAPKLEKAEIERARRKPTDSLDAYDYFLRGLASFHLFIPQENDKALAQFFKAIEFDAGYASAYGMATWCYQRRYSFRWGENREQDRIEAMRLAGRAVAMGKDDAVALYAAGFTFVVVAHDVEGGAALIERALQLNPNSAVAWGLSGLVHAYLGVPETAIEHVQRGMRLSPLDPLSYVFHGWLARAQFVAGRYEEAAASAENALRGHPEYLSPLIIGTAVYSLLNRAGDARRLSAHLRDLHPQLRISTITDHPFRRHADLVAFEAGLRKAGLPE
jgi:TolB-like protein/class 3 adenylate cyclase/tetratricopeptide (TPR) repeat protein